MLPYAVNLSLSFSARDESNVFCVWYIRLVWCEWKLVMDEKRYSELFGSRVHKHMQQHFYLASSSTIVSFNRFHFFISLMILLTRTWESMKSWMRKCDLFIWWRAKRKRDDDFLLLVISETIEMRHSNRQLITFSFSLHIWCFESMWAFDKGNWWRCMYLNGSHHVQHHGRFRKNRCQIKGEI